MKQRTTPATPDEKIVHHAKVWRRSEKDALGTRSDVTKRIEYHALQQLRKVIDEAER